MVLWIDKYKILQSDLFLGRVALLSLVVQNAAVVLVTRYSRARKGDLYFPTTAVVMSELVKLLVCFLLVFFEEKCSIVSCIHSLWENILNDPKDCLLVSVPGMIYTIQNNLLFVGYSNLDAVSFQISYQLKIFTTAIFFRIILSKHLSRIQWCSLGVLFTGVVLTQLSDVVNSSSEETTNIAENNNLLVGLSSVILACSCSGFAGVFFEKLLKGSHKSVAIRNIQLAFYGVTAGILTVYLKDGKEISIKGFFFGYDSVVWAAILIQSLGGLLIAATIRYADNIRKGFATSLAIVLTFILSTFWFDFNPTVLFYVGAILVVVATILYSSYPPSSNHGTTTNNKISSVNSFQNSSSESNFRHKLCV
ncbi:unnamed protein product [Schistosoma intercalatum]|nr:unnamed protein product [Schistosoma intercalatum]CAH8551114.1 unnamed protein product [Schistosoma intercalatum]